MYSKLNAEQQFDMRVKHNRCFDKIMHVWNLKILSYLGEIYLFKKKFNVIVYSAVFSDKKY